MADNKSALLKKLHAVMQVVDHIGKRGRNSQQNYDYLMAEDVLAEVRQEFVTQGLVLIPGCTNQQVREGQTKSGTTNYLTEADFTYSIYDIETGESLSVPWKGQGQDSGDKGLYKALTGGIKYFLRNLLMIPTGDDPENDGSQSRARQPQAQGQQRQTQPTSAPSRPQTAPPSQKPAEPLANEQHLQTLLGERKKREGGWEPILAVLKLKGMPALEGRPKEEQERLMGEYMHQITVTEANDILRAIRALPYKSAGASQPEIGG